MSNYKQSFEFFVRKSKKETQIEHTQLHYWTVDRTFCSLIKRNELIFFSIKKNYALLSVICFFRNEIIIMK